MKKSLVFAAVLVPALALAQPKSADDWYKEGETQYNLGEFEKAAEAFKQGFSVETDESKKPAYLYNVAQAYRQGNKCRDAAFFYKRYLALKDRDTVKPLKPEKRAEIEQRIAELDECARTQDSIANKPPGDTIRPGGDGSKTGAKTGTGTGTAKTGTGTGTGTAKTGTGPTGTGTGAVVKTGTGPTGTGTGTGAGGATTGTGTGTGATGTGTGTGTAGTGTGAKTGTGTGTVAGTGSGSGTGAGSATGTGTGPTVGDAGEGDDEGDDEGGDEEYTDSLTSGVAVQPRVLNARVVAGVSKISMGDLPTGVKPAFSLTGGYPVLTQGPLGVDVGASLGFSPVPYENGMTGATENASMTTLLVNGAATYTVAPKIAVRGDLGLGVLLFGGLKMGNPFTDEGAEASGALGMFALRVAASADYAITPNITATVTPISVGYSPAKDGLRSDVSTILRLEFMAGVGYRM